MYFFFMHNHGGRLYIHTNTGQVLCVLLWLPNGLSPSVLAPSLMFLESPPNSGYSRSNAFHWIASEVRQQLILFGVINVISWLLPFRMPSHELRFLRVREIALQTWSDRKVPRHFSRCFLPFLVSTHAAHRTCGFLRVLAPINDAIVDAYVISNVR